MKNKQLGYLLLLGVLFALPGCGGGSSEPEQTLEERVVARWESMIARDFEAVWEYHSPGFRQTTPQADFVRDMQRRPVRWHSVDFVGLDCGEDVCEVSVLIEYQAAGAPGAQSRMRLNRVVEEQWIRIGDQWWFSAS